MPVKPQLLFDPIDTILKKEAGTSRAGFFISL